MESEWGWSWPLSKGRGLIMVGGRGLEEKMEEDRVSKRV